MWCFSQKLFVATQSCLLLLLVIHDWIDLAPFNDIFALRANAGVVARIVSTCANSVLIACALVGTLYFRQAALPMWFRWYLVVTYGLPLLGGFMVWYRPMLLGGQAWNKEHFKKTYARTHHLIPGGDEDVRPNTMRIAIHILIVLSAVLAFCKAMGRF